jgi:uncharacterized C2H2 Zn-finger protein
MPFPCERCEKVFKKTRELNRHINRKFPCKVVKRPQEVAEIKELLDDVITDVAEIKEFTEKITPEVEKITPILNEESFDLIKSDIIVDVTDAKPQNELDNIYNSLKFEPLNLEIDIINDGYTICIYGSSKSGKTFFLKWLLKKYFSDSKLISTLMSPSISKPVYKDIDKKIIRSNKFQPRVMKSFRKIQQLTKSKYRFLTILDDVVNCKTSAQIRSAILTDRNLYLNFIICLQYSNLLDKGNRGSINHYIFKRYNNNEIVAGVMDLFLSGYEPFTSQKKMIDKINLYKRILNNRENFILLNTLDDKISFHKNIL